MPRTKSYDPDDVLRRAIEVFWEKGYEATSISDLEQAMGVNRYSLYDSFGGKKQLFLACLTAYRSDVMASQTSSLVDTGGMAGIAAFFDSLLETPRTLRGHGCLVMNSLVELSGRDPEIDTAVKRHVRFVEKRLRQAIEQAQRDDDIASIRDARTVARHLLALLQGILALGKSEFGRPIARAAIRSALEDFLPKRVSARPRSLPSRIRDPRRHTR